MLIESTSCSPPSFRNILEKWIPEVTRHIPNAKIILVGTKADLQKDADTLDILKRKGLAPVEPAEVRRLLEHRDAKSIIGHYVTSSLTGHVRSLPGRFFFFDQRFTELRRGSQSFGRP